MVLVDELTNWSHDITAKPSGRLRVHHPTYPLRSGRLDNAEEFISTIFDKVLHVVLDFDNFRSGKPADSQSICLGLEHDRSFGS